MHGQLFLRDCCGISSVRANFSASPLNGKFPVSNLKPFVPGGQGAFALNAVAFLLVANLLAELFFERHEQIEGDVGGLEVLAFGVGDVVRQRAVGGEARGGCGCLAAGEGGGEASGEQAGGDGFGVAFDAGELAGDEDVGVAA